MTASAGIVPDGSSTVGSSSGGATAGTVGQAITSTSAKAAASERRVRVRITSAREITEAGISIRYLARARLIGPISLLIELSFCGERPASPSEVPSSTAASPDSSSPGTSISRTLPPVSTRRASIASSQALRTPSLQSSLTAPLTTPIRNPRASPAGSCSP